MCASVHVLFVFMCTSVLLCMFSAAYFDLNILRGSLILLKRFYMTEMHANMLRKCIANRLFYMQTFLFDFFSDVYYCATKVKEFIGFWCNFHPCLLLMMCPVIYSMVDGNEPKIYILHTALQKSISVVNDRYLMSLALGVQ